MKTRWRSESDNWSATGDKITQSDRLAAIRACLENSGPIIVEHWYYRGSCAPSRHVFEDYDKFVAYLNEQSFAGDIIEVWEFSKVCKADVTLASGKCPDENGEVPKGGAY